MAYVHNAPWYYAADGTPVQAVATEEGWTFPQAPVDDDGAQIRVIDDPAEVLALNTQALGFNPDDKRVNPDQSVSIMNPQTQQYEQAVAAGESGALMPISMAQEQNLPIYQYAMEPKDTGKLGQIVDIATPLAKLAAVAYGANALGTGSLPGLGGDGGMTASVADSVAPSQVASYTAPELGMGGAQGLQVGGGGLGLQAPVTGNLASMGGAQGLVAPVGTSFAGAAIPAAVGAAGAAGSVLGGTGGATTLANAGLGATAAGAGGAAATGGTALSRLTGIDPDVLSVAGQVAGAGLGAYASNEQSGALTDMANKYLEYGAPSRARYEASMSPGFNPSSIPGYQGAVDNAMEATLRKLSTQGNPFGNPGGLIEANKSVVAGTALPALQEYQRLNAGTGGIASLNAAAPSTSAAATGANANIYNAIGYGIDQATAQPSTLDSLLKRLASKTTPAYGLA